MLHQQMENRYAHASALELCDIRRDIHVELGREMKRQLACVDPNLSLILHQVLLEEEEVIHHMRNLFVTGVEYGLEKLTSTESSAEALKGQLETLEKEVAHGRIELRKNNLALRNVKESVRSKWDVLTWKNKVEREALLDKKDDLKDLIARAARLLRHSFLWDEYDTMPIEEDIKDMLMEELRVEREKKEIEEFEFGESVEAAVVKLLPPDVTPTVGYTDLVVGVDINLFEHVDTVSAAVLEGLKPKVSEDLVDDEAAAAAATDRSATVTATEKASVEAPLVEEVSFSESDNANVNKMAGQNTNIDSVGFGSRSIASAARRSRSIASAARRSRSIASAAVYNRVSAASSANRQSKM